MKKYKVVIIVLVVLGIIGALVGKYYFDKKPEGLGDKKPDFTMSCDSIFNEFVTNKDVANKKYLGKTVLLDGVVESVEKDSTNVSVIFKTSGGQGNVVCRMDSTDAMKVNVNGGQKLQLKGECTMYEDDLLIELSFNRCVMPH